MCLGVSLTVAVVCLKIVVLCLHIGGWDHGSREQQ